jgi:hypothetical protein
MVEAQPLFFPLGWISKPDLLYCREDLRSYIEQLEPVELDQLVQQVGNELQPYCMTAIQKVLHQHFGAPPKEVW